MIAFLAALVAPAAPAAAMPGPLLADRNGDGEVVVACLGDSNTQSDWQAGAAGGFPASRGWCERLEALFGGRVRTVNLGVGGATAMLNSELPVGNDEATFDARGQFRIALQKYRPDIFLLAFGTNDLLERYSTRPKEVVMLYRELWLEARSEDLLLLVATVPAVQVPEQVRQAFRFSRGGGLHRQADIETANRLIHASFPERLIVDFGSGFAPDDFLDRVHLNANGQEKRARTARQAILRALRELPELSTARQLTWQGGRWGTLSPRPGVAAPQAESFLVD